MPKCRFTEYCPLRCRGTILIQHGVIVYIMARRNDFLFYILRAGDEKRYDFDRCADTRVRMETRDHLRGKNARKSSPAGAKLQMCNVGEAAKFAQ